LSEINTIGYVTRTTSRNTRKGSSVHRDWFFVKYDTATRCYANPGKVYLPLHLAGKKVKFKIEVLEE